MFERKFVTVPELYVGDLAQNGNWMVGCVRSAIGWPLAPATVTFRTRTLYLLPVATHPGHEIVNHPAVAVRLGPGEQLRDGQVLISHFLSSLAWANRQSVEVIGWLGGNLPRSMGGYNGGTIMTDRFHCRYFPDPDDPNARLALGFYREGMYLNHVAYQCLSYFKILNIFLRGGPAQIGWMNANAHKVSDQQAKGRIGELGSDVGTFLYGSNRCAVAHAGGRPTADPENPEDMAQLQDDLPLVRAFAEIAIEEHFGVKSALTVWREHLYELEGFREVFGVGRVKTIKEAGTLPSADWPKLPRLSIRLAGHDSYDPLEDMDASVVDSGDGMVVIDCRGNSGLTVIRLGLNFRDERLQFDVLEGLASADNKTAAAARSYSRVQQFRLDYFMNGELEVREGDGVRLLGRADPFVPMNVDMTGTVNNFRKTIAAIEAEAEERENEDRGLGRPQPYSAG
jgi:hypothetical protein